MWEGVFGAGPNLEYLVVINIFVKDKLSFPKRSMISYVEGARTSG